MTYRLDDLELVCPACRGDLQETSVNAELRCDGCGTAYPVIAGIPDLRTFPDPYISLRGDRTKAEMLARHFDDLDFAGILELYFDVTPEVPPRDVRLNTYRVLGGVARAEAALESLHESSAIPAAAVPGNQHWLDVGCGSAPLVAALASRGVPVAGVDIAMRWLMIGRKRLQELGLRAPLVAACAEALPFRDGVFDVVAFQSALEVVRDQPQALSDAWRVSRSGARIVVNTPNRLSVGPDPHVGVFGGGWLPRPVVNLVARLQLVRPPHRALLSRGRLERLLRDARWDDVAVSLPGVSRAQREQFHGLTRRLAELYETSRTTPGLRTMLQVVGPLLQATAVKR